MRLYELEDQEIYHPAVQNFLDIVRQARSKVESLTLLNQAGYKLLGRGDCGIVMNSPAGAGDFIVKFWSIDAGYEKAVACFAENQMNPHFPRLLAGPIRNVKNVDNVLFMNEMQSLSDHRDPKSYTDTIIIDIAKGILVSDITKNYVSNHIEAEWSRFKNSYREHDDFFNQCLGLSNALKILKAFAPDKRFDLHYGNFMRHPGGDIVVTDPFWS